MYPPQIEGIGGDNERLEGYEVASQVKTNAHKTQPPSPPVSPVQVKSTEQEKSRAILTITEANPVGASILVLNEQYYKSVLQQAQRSFLWALCAAVIGLLFFLAAVAFLLLR